MLDNSKQAVLPVNLRCRTLILILLFLVALQLVDEEFDALEGFFYVLEHGILQLLENVETYLHHLQVGCTRSTQEQLTGNHLAFTR